MADRKEREYREGGGRKRALHAPGGEFLAALFIVILVIGVAFGVNKFFYGFDHAENPFTGTSISESEKGGEQKKTEKTFTQSDDWRLLLVNRNYPLEQDFDGELTELRYGQSVDSRIYPDLQEMFDEMRSEGLEPRVVLGYCTAEEQGVKLENKIKEYMGYGKSRGEAEELAVQWVAEPGTSEHETGLCVDISSDSGDNESADAIWRWMNENCSRFGFIKRYPNDRFSITGVKGEAWHYRYVGADAAQEITQRGITLEEYLGAVTAE